MQLPIRVADANLRPERARARVNPNYFSSAIVTDRLPKCSGDMCAVCSDHSTPKERGCRGGSKHGLWSICYTESFPFPSLRTFHLQT